MCEILLRLTDKVNSNPILDSRLTKRGDVIAVQEDGWPWGDGEISSGEYVVIKLPNVTVSQASPFVSPELEVDPKNPSPVLQRRGFKLNIASIPQGVLDKINNRVPGQGVTFNATPAQIAALKVKKTPLPNPLTL